MSSDITQKGRELQLQLRSCWKKNGGEKKKTPSRTCFWCWPAYMTRVRGGGWVESSVALAKQSLTWQMVLGLCFCVPPSLSWLINGVHYIRPSPWPSCDSIFWFDSDYPFREMVLHFGHRLPNYIDTSCHLSLQSHAEAMLESPFNLHVFAWWQKAGAPRENPRRHGKKMQTSHRRAPASWQVCPLNRLAVRQQCWKLHHRSATNTQMSLTSYQGCSGKKGGQNHWISQQTYIITKIKIVHFSQRASVQIYYNYHVHWIVLPSMHSQ